MSQGKFTVLVGGQYGSEGKGAIVRKIANQYDVHVRVGSPNAGHTIYWRGAKHVMQSIPCGWINPDAKIVIGRGALLNMKQLMMEIVHIQKYYPDFLDRLFIDRTAGILDEHFHEEEGGTHGEMHKRIGSTGEGVGPARIARLKRDPELFHQFGDIAAQWGLEQCITDSTPHMIAYLNDCGENVLIEGTQGSGLSLLHSFWPYCTSIDTNAAGIISEVGVAPSRVTDVLLVVRTHPIRVAGTSGPMDREITWEQLSSRLGKRIEPEHTTVTKKIRRIAEWDRDLFVNSCILNNPTELALTFADYVDPALYGVTDPGVLESSDLLQQFIEENIGDDVPIRYIGTGPKTVVEMEVDE